MSRSRCSAPQELLAYVEGGLTADARAQLAALGALLTAATAEHFVPHGEALMQTVRKKGGGSVGGGRRGKGLGQSGAPPPLSPTLFSRPTLFQVRTAFNYAVAGAAPDVRRAARGALLQTLATALKRVAHDGMMARHWFSIGRGCWEGGLEVKYWGALLYRSRAFDTPNARQTRILKQHLVP